MPGVIGFVQLGFAALMETTLDPALVNPLRGFITIGPNVSPLRLGGNWAVGTGSTFVTTVVMVLVTAWIIRHTVSIIGRQT